MNIYIKTFIFEKKENISKKLDLQHLYNMGFETTVVLGDHQKLLELLTERKSDIVIFNSEGCDTERMNYVLEIVYNHFCKNIVVIGKKPQGESKYIYISGADDPNFDLKLNMTLLSVKKEIESRPSRNITLIRNKICQQLYDFMFSSRLDGFKYYMDAVLMAYVSFPYNYPTMDIYREVAKNHGKTVCAVEKSMRTALQNAFARLKDAPLTPENVQLKSYLTYDMNNNTAISMIVSRLVLDKELNPDGEIGDGKADSGLKVGF